MKHGVLALVFCVAIIANSSAQQSVGFRNLSLIEPALKLCYIGIDNVIEVYGITDLTDVELNAKHARVFRQNSSFNHFSLFPNRLGLDTIAIFQGSKLLFQQVVEYAKINNLECRIAGLSSNQATVAQLLDKPELEIHIPNCFWNAKCRVVSFEAYKIGTNDTVLLVAPFKSGGIDTIYVEDPITGEQTIEFRPVTERYAHTNNNKLTDFQKSEIKKACRGEKFLFREIKAVGSDGSVRKLNDIVVEII